MRGGWAMDRDDLYEQAGVGPRDMDFVEVYDDYPVITALQLEDLGFCEQRRRRRSSSATIRSPATAACR